MLESFRLRLSNSVLVFLDIRNSERLSTVRESLIQAGGSSSSPRTIVFPAKTGVTVDKICKLVDFLPEGDCVTVVLDRDGETKSIFIVPPKGNPVE